MNSYISAYYVGDTVKYDPTLKITKRVGGWVLEWEPYRPNTVWAIPEHLKTFKRADSGILYGTSWVDEVPSYHMGWDWPDSTPAYVRQVAPAFIIQCQTQHNATERGNQ